MISKPTKSLVRIIIYATLVVMAFGVAYIHGKTLEAKKRDQALQVLKREINSHWGLTKIEIDMVNESTQSYIDRNGLKPGEPLQPRVLAQDNPALRQILKKMTTFYYIKTFSASSGPYSTKAVAIIVINNKVPQEGEKYAYGAIEHNYEVFGSVYSIYPNDQFAIGKLKRALRAYAKTIQQ